MRRLGLALVCTGASLIAAAAVQPAHAAPVDPNGSVSVTIDGPDKVDTGDITAATSLLTLSGAEAVGSFTDPFLSNPNNLCGAAGGGCLAANPPGFLLVGATVTQSAEVFNVFGLGTGTHPFLDHVTLTQGADSIDFDFTSIFTAVLTPTTATTSGTLTLDLLGTFASDSTGVDYNLGQSASMAINCGQTSPGSSISCSKTISTPSTVTPPHIPEPASLALLGSALVGFGAIRRRRKAA